MPKKNPDPKAHDLPASPSALAAAVEAALAEAERAGLTSLGRAEQASIRLALERLCDCTQEIAGSELVVAGSTGQQRPHPLLKVEKELRREVTENLKRHLWTHGNRLLLERLNGLTSGAES